MRSFFITATDTGVGKTTITAAIAALLKSQGIDVGVMKPFATGTQQKTGYKSEDVAILANSIHCKDSEDLMNPYFFPIPASPYSAANKLKVSIDTGRVLQSFEKLQAAHQVMMVEGIGGILTPILKDYCIADLIKELNLGTIIVTSSRLGTVNHTLMTISAAKDFGLHIRGIIINGIDSGGYDQEELKNDLTNLSGVEVLCIIPHFDDVKTGKIVDVLKDNNVISKLSS